MKPLAGSVSTALVLLLAGGGLWAQVPVVAGGQARAVVVTAAEPTPLAAYAAAELVYHVRRATGVTLPIVGEPAVPDGMARVYVGPCDAARAAGIDPSRLAAEATRLKTAAEALFIVGDDGAGDPMSNDTRAGTLWGVYEVLERVLGVRWLWPGELGTFVPRAEAVQVPVLDETIAPHLLQRNVRPGMLERPSPTPGFSAPVRADYVKAQAVFLRRHRMGRASPLKYGHAFEDWWATYGAAHPEWFQMVNGKRGPASPGARFSMCVSDPGFHQQIVALWRAYRQEHPEGARNVNCCENDIAGLCACERCLSWDGPQPAEIPPRFGPRVVSDRYARYWQAVYDLAVKDDPDVVVMAYAYVNYAPPPLTRLTLSPNILVGTVPDLFFPRTPEHQQWVKDQWLGWRQTGCTLFLRPNYTLHGYVMPFIYVHQFADEFQFEAAHGMRATDFDSLTGQWATQGTNTYALMRLHTRPGVPIDRLLGEYYEGFGPAAAQVQRYFDFWEAHTHGLLTRATEVGRSGIVNWSVFARDAHRLFPPESFAEAAGILAEARRATGATGEFSERVGFLQLGLEHAQLCARIAAMIAGTDADSSPYAAGRATRRIAEFRREHEGRFISNLTFAATIEGRSWSIPAGWDGAPVRPLRPDVSPLTAAEPVFSVRGSGSVLAALQAGESFRTRIQARQVGRNPAAVSWALVGPEDRVIRRGEVALGQTADLDIPVPGAGTYALFVQSNMNRALLTARNDHAALLGPKVAFVSESSPVFFLVPEGMQRFTVGFAGSWPGETVRVRVHGPDGAEVGSGEVERKGPQTIAVDVPAGSAGKAWSLSFEKTDKGVLEDYTIELGPGLPPLLAHAADRLVLPAAPAGER